MTAAPTTGLEAILLDNRARLVRFLAARGAGDHAEDVFHELWQKIAGQPERPVAQTLAAFGGLDGAFNNAAIPQAGLPLAEVSLERFRQSMDLNVTGTFLFMKDQILAMIERGTKGSIVNPATVAGVENGKA